MHRLSSKFPHLLALAGALSLCACGADSRAPGTPEAQAVPTQTAQRGVTACTAPPVQPTHTVLGENTNVPVQHKLSDTAYPLAVCNDGTQATYFFRPGVGAGSKRWLIYLEGGGNCHSLSECQDRWNLKPGLMSSQKITDGETVTKTLEAIKSPKQAENPDFYDANFVQLNYCSSDSWSGNKQGDDSLGPDHLERWHFRGRRIIEAVIADLQSRGINTADEVFLMGSSAGGVGVLNNTDAIQARLPSSVRFVSLMDAGFYIDYPAYDPNTHQESTASPTSREQELADTAAVWNARGDASCEAAAADYASKLLCRSAEHVIGGGYISTPLFVRQSQIDAIQLKTLIPEGVPDADTVDYRLRFAASMRDRLSQLPQTAVFSTFDTEHGVINSNSEWNASIIDGLPLPQAIGDWYRAPCNQMVLRIQQP